MAGICVAALAGMTLQAALAGCASSGTVAAEASSAPGTSSSAPTAPDSQDSTSQSSLPPVAESSATSATSAAQPSPPAPGPGAWTPVGELAHAEPIDEVLNPDKSVTATWPKGAPKAHALTIKLRAARTDGKIVIHLYVDNESGKQVTLNEGLFTGGVVLDEHGTALKSEEFDPLWTLGPGSDDGHVDPGQPLLGDFVVDAPASGSTLNAYWSQAVEENGLMDGILLVRNIPIN